MGERGEGGVRGKWEKEGKGEEVENERKSGKGRKGEGGVRGESEKEGKGEKREMGERGERKEEGNWR